MILTQTEQVYYTLKYWISLIGNWSNTCIKRDKDEFGKKKFVGKKFKNKSKFFSYPNNNDARTFRLLSSCCLLIFNFLKRII